MVDRVGQQLGNYRLLRLLGQGGQASVYLGEHLYLKSQAALKVRHTVLTEEERAVFLQEAQALVRLAHPHIVRVLDFALQDGMPFLVMEYAPHGTLRQRHPKGTQLPLDLILPYIQQVASALQYSHDQGLIHRDVKLENMLLNSQDQMLLSDFGLVMHAPHLLSSEATEPMELSLVGTTSYLAPEQLRGKAQPASDQYALGVVVYEWLCGKPPFRGAFLEVAVKHVSVPPPSLREQVPNLSPAIEEVVMRALAKEPEQRFARVQDFATALEHASKPASSPRLTPVLAQKHEAEMGQEKSSMPHLPRGTVTLLFTDMEGSTRLLQQLGDRYASVLAECRHLLRAAFHHWGGHEVDTQGDAFFVAFARATDALSAAVAAQRALTSHTWPTGVTVRVRMGLHTGEPELTPEGYVGLDVHHTARIMSAGHGGQILLSQTTRALVEQELPAEVSLRDLGVHRLKDLQRPTRLFQVVIAGLPADFPPLKTLNNRPHNLPVQPTPLIGREQEVAAVGHLLRREEVRLVTLTGPGGVGKTRLGLQVVAELSDRFAAGVFFVNLAPVSDPALVVPTIAQTLDIREAAGQTPLQRLVERLQQQDLLLLLDNFEQVVSAAGQIADLLAACPQLKVLVTSRAVLHVRAEHEFAVPPLALPDPTRLPDLAVLPHYAAVALFLACAQATKPDFQLTAANAHAIAEICVRLDGLPLAIELAAARIKLLPPQALLTRLSQRLTVLTGVARDVPARQQRLRNTIQWSYDLLDVEEQRLFRRLSVFVGGCTLEAVEAVCGAGGDASAGMGGSVLDGVASLIDKSLLHQTEQEGEEPRLAMLETIREYGREALAASGEAEVIQRAHAAYYLALAEEAEPRMTGAGMGRWLERLQREHENLRATLTFLLERARVGMPEGQEQTKQALRLCTALHWFWKRRGYLREGQTFLEQALAGGPGVVTPTRARALYMAAELAGLQGDMERSEALGRESLALYRELVDNTGMAYSLYHLGRVAWTRSQYVTAHAQLEEAMALFQEVGDTRGRANCLLFVARLSTSQGEYGQARALLEESLGLYRALGDQRRMGWVLYLLARVLFLAQGDPATASALAEQSQTLLREEGEKWIVVYLLGLLGQMRLVQGEQALARALLEESAATFKELGDRWGIAESLIGLARVALVQGDLAAARRLYQESLVLLQEAGYEFKEFIAAVLEGLGAVVGAQGAPAWAAHLWGAAEALREAIGAPMPPVYRADYERAVAATRTVLGEEAFGRAWAEGRATPLDQGTSNALKMGG